MISKQTVRQLAEERIKDRDERLFIVELTISASNVIRLELDKTEGNVSIEDCMSVSRNIEHNLDREDADFELHVSSAGLDKPLRVHAQYVKNIGRDLDVKLKSKEKTTGTLIAVDEAGIVLKREEKQAVEGKKKKELVVIENKIAFSDINEAKIVISFK
ncbi:ribosome assembly cofactor RimP [uncultured Fluviicola sp.]|jgi:ribosome maturation factor RimP|uniref:ribosome assembly cofactor RimP n=1 Tax=uncultured Fluviicola sp. TaxID=463303 RepID=UPI0025E8E5E4|nr:ribosome assembly cofactor RimP [uncultured Fluviicola sp.]